MTDLTVLILTYNEELHIARVLSCISTIAKEVFIIDSGSTDNTVEIAERYGAHVLYNKFINQAKQLQWALDNTFINTSWIMRLDADETLEPDLIEEMALKLPILPSDVVGINLKRKHFFMDRWIRHGGRYPLRMLRIWRQGCGRIEDRWMDEHIVTSGGRVITFNGGFADHNLNDLTYFIEKHNKYATREAIDVLNQRLNLFPIDGALNSENSSMQASIKRQIKERLYNKIPFGFSTTMYFLWRYIIRLGFLDGVPGLIYHFLQGWWYRFLFGAKILELENSIAHIENKDEICAELSKITGYSLCARKH